MTHLSKIIKIDSDKCVLCFKCIQVCPMKFCNIAKDDFVDINDDLCIGCGACLDVCDPGARRIADDFDQAMNDLQKGIPMVAVVAPAVAANFPDSFLNLNGWLISRGVSAVFDTSFGAELTVKSYVEAIKENKPEMMIAQPCPAVVNFIQLQRPNLIPYLAPADSPMVHIMKMIREFYPRYQNHRIMVISPCIAKKREFEETGFGDYNITMISLVDYLKNLQINIKDYEETDFDNPPAERAVLFSSPGGLMKTAERELLDIAQKTRKIEGYHSVYPYLAHLDEALKENKNPLLIDILNCEKGCNGGTGTYGKKMNIDILEDRINQRAEKMRRRHHTLNKKNHSFSLSAFRRNINKFWKKNIYNRTYKDLSSNKNYHIPNNEEIQKIFKEDLLKETVQDIKNCAACGYDKCEQMAIALYNGLNRKENCKIFIKKELNIVLDFTQENLNKLLNSADNVEQTKLLSDQGFSVIENLENQMKTVEKSSGNIKKIIEVIDHLSLQTTILSLNASVEAARSQDSGRSFSIIAKQMQDLSKRSSESVVQTTEEVENSLLQISKVSALVKESAKNFKEIKEKAEETAGQMKSVTEKSRSQTDELSKITHAGDKKHSDSSIDRLI